MPYSQTDTTLEHGYDCIYQGSTPRSWERTVNASYVESLEKKVQRLEANTLPSTTASPAVNQQAYVPQLPRLESLEYRPNEQRATDTTASTRYGPISSSTPPGRAVGETTHVHQNSSRIRSREHDTTRNGTAEDDSHEVPLESEVRDVNTYTEVCPLCTRRSNQEAAAFHGALHLATTTTDT